LIGRTPSVHVVNSTRIPLLTYNAFSPYSPPSSPRYRLIDTAECYRNHANVREGIADACAAGASLAVGVGPPTRSSYFITSKVAPRSHGRRAARASCLKMLKELGVDYIDLVLIHWPGTSRKPGTDPGNRERRLQSWLALEELYRQGVCRAIGVSNYTVRHLRELIDDERTSVVPAVNQVEVHPLFPQRELRDACREFGIHVQAYSSFGQGSRALLDHGVVQGVAETRNISTTQVLLRWALGHGLSVLPMSTNEDHIVANAGCVGATTGLPTLLSDEDRDSLDAMGAKENHVKFAWDPADIA